MRHERGFMLPMVIFSLAIMGVLVLVMVGTGDDDRTGSRYDYEGTRSFYAAETGPAHILTNWKANGYEATMTNVGDTTGVAWTPLAGVGSYHAVLQKVDVSTYMITVDGRTPGARKGLRTVQMMLTPSISFSYAVMAGSNMKLHAGFTDSFNSDSGLYSAQTPGSDGDVRSNGTITQLSESPPLGVINGDVVAYDNSSTTTSAISSACADPAKVTGDCTTGASQLPMPDQACPGGGYSTLPTPLPGGVTYSSRALTVNSSYTLPVGQTTWFFKSITTNGSGVALTVNPNGTHVDLYIQDVLKTQGGSSLANASMNPTLLTVYGCGLADAAQNWVLSGGSQAVAFVLYAPRDNITISGGSGIYGALIAKTFDISGNSATRFDEARLTFPWTKLAPGSWTEITG